jgi:stage II sporulation protein AA (anti-sigma F factor antagonist)
VESNFSVDVQDGEQAVLIVVSGELDLASSPELERELKHGTASEAELLIIDLRKLEFMDSTGLSVLVRAHQNATQSGKRFAIVKGPQQVERLLSLTGVAERLTVVDTPEELLAGS